MPELDQGFSKNLNSSYLGFWLIIPLSNIAIHKELLVPPNLLFFLLGTMVLVAGVAKAKVNSILGLPILVILYFLITQALIGAPFTRFMGVLIAVSYFVVIIFFSNNLSIDRVNKLSDFFIKLAVVLLMIECFWRLTHPNIDYAQFEGSGDVRWIYLYKYSSFMYSDSNATAIHIVVILFYIFYLEQEHSQKWTKSKWILAILLIFTFSRAAWLGGVLGWVYIRFLQKKSLVFYFLNIIIISIFSFLLYQLYLRDKITNDLSLQSKFEILEIVLNYFRNASIEEWIFGVGFSNSIERLEIYAHNFEMVFLIESGILGLSLMILLMVHFVLITKRKALFIIVPFILTTLSATITFMPFFYVSMALIYLKTQTK